MQKSVILSAVMALGFASSAFGAAALASGAKTSCKATSTDPVKRQMQIAADPQGITDFQFSIQFDPSLVRVANDVSGLPMIRAINGYSLGFRDNFELAPYAIDTQNGIVSVRGFWPSTGGQVPMEELDVFDVVFELLPGNPDLGIPEVPLNQILVFNSLGFGPRENPFGPDFPDFMNAGSIDLQTGRPVVDRVFTAGDPNNPILFSTSGPVAIVPEPGAMALIIPFALPLMRRKR